MRKFLGALLVVVGAVSLFVFAIRGTMDVHSGDTPVWKIPLKSLGRDYPNDAGWLMGGVWGIGLGVGLLLLAGSRPGGTVARIFLANGIMIFTMLALGAIGARTQDPNHQALVGVFFGTALLEIGAGLILFILALFERPKGVFSLLVGTAVYLSASAMGVLAFLWGS